MRRTATRKAAPGAAGDLVYRPARPGDDAAIAALDGSFTTDSVFEVTATPEGFAIREVPVHPPLHKVFPDEEDEGDEGDGQDHADEGDGQDHADAACGADGTCGPDRAGHGAGPGRTRTVVAVDGEELCGFVTVSFEPWNGRATVRDIEVAPAWRGAGVGRALMEHAVGFARECGAVHLWLEVSNVNAPAVHAYLRMGFTFCGLDTSLYAGTESSGEQALFMTRPLH
ncbi:GNAT family N-acetyltransferase [Streptomyces sp. NPDC013455]|uniref:GNAT family N-acetyltransferase n=1 Tax=Streptomyces sp. NPDC013455 TaxID=3155605 RepID=UPI0033D37F00